MITRFVPSCCSSQFIQCEKTSLSLPPHCLDLWLGPYTLDPLALRLRRPSALQKFTCPRSAKTDITRPATSAPAVSPSPSIQGHPTCPPRFLPRRNALRHTISFTQFLIRCPQKRPSPFLATPQRFTPLCLFHLPSACSPPSILLTLASVSSPGMLT